MFDGSTDSPTVTIYAHHSPLIARIADEVRDRGASTHTVSIETGWVRTVSRALVVLDSAAGRSAVRGLCEADPHGARVVALLADPSDAEAEDLCERCVERHDMVVLRGDGDDVISRAVDELVGAAAS